ncbi:MAG: DUF1015 family protein, partial [Acidimicrobiia bacterium]|nr:DUF1015 family protein [Acidimicrobiia bacterium]
MPNLAPFRGLRYAAGIDLDGVVAPPYDVILENDRDHLEATSINNAVRLILPRALDSLDPYQTAARLANEWRGTDVLILESSPALYAYSMTTAEDHQTIGVIGALAINGPTGEILPHECTLPKARSDRLALLRATRMNLDPIWGLSMTSGLTKILETIPRPQQTSIDNVRHELGVIDNPELIKEISNLIALSPLVLADGHHRYETARNYLAEAEASGDKSTGNAFIMTLIVELSESVLDVEPIHRLVSSAPKRLREDLGLLGELIPIGPNDSHHVKRLESEMQSRSGIGFIDAQGIALFIPDAKELARRLESEPSELHSVDSVRFDQIVRP